MTLGDQTGELQREGTWGDLAACDVLERLLRSMDDRPEPGWHDRPTRCGDWPW